MVDLVTVQYINGGDKMKDNIIMINKAIADNEVSTLHIIAATKQRATNYYNKIIKHITKTDVIVWGSRKTNDMNTHNDIIILCDEWFKNKNAQSDDFKDKIADSAAVLITNTKNLTIELDIISNLIEESKES